MTPEQEQQLFETLGRLDARSKQTAADIAQLRDGVHRRLEHVEAEVVSIRKTCAIERALNKDRLQRQHRLIRPWYVAIIAALVSMCVEGVRVLVGIFSR